MSPRIAALPFCLVAAWLSLGMGQSGPAQFGGLYATLPSVQRRLVDNWVKEYGRVTGTTIDAAATYDALPPSTRTTFEAVTHALMTSTLTTAKGKSLGTALDLVQLVEAVHGQVPGVRGDHQFRIYVLLKPDALDRLYKSREFKRVRDNTIFHIGYTLNFRQQGGVPSIQVSVTRTGRRADIDVDYRSSSGPWALFNGHLTSANSDVRAGSNFQRHVDRWVGLRDWWEGLFGVFRSPADEKIELGFGVSIPEKPAVSAERPVTDAAFDFYRSWLVNATPEAALAYMSVRAYACLAEYQSGESLESGLAAVRILQHMRKAQQANGAAGDLSDVLQSIAIYPPNARPLVHDHGSLFSAQHLTDTMARDMDCRVRQRVTLVDPLPYGGDSFGDYYATETRLLKETGPDTVMTQLWGKEEGYWKLMSWHLEHPFVGGQAQPLEIPTNEPPTKPSDAPERPSHAGIVKEATAFLDTWLVERRYEDAAAYFAPRCNTCSDIQSAGSVVAYLSSIASHVPRRTALGDLVTAIPFGHPHLQKVAHPGSSAFLLTAVSTALAPTLECRAVALDRRSVAGSPRFDGKAYRTDFAFKGTEGEAGAVSLLWRIERGHWRIVAADIVAR
jgi:hypothetical protein